MPSGSELCHPGDGRVLCRTQSQVGTGRIWKPMSCVGDKGFGNVMGIQQWEWENFSLLNQYASFYRVRVMPVSKSWTPGVCLPARENNRSILAVLMDEQSRLRFLFLFSGSHITMLP